MKIKTLDSIGCGLGGGGSKVMFKKISQNFVRSPLKFCLISQILVHSSWHVATKKIIPYTGKFFIEKEWLNFVSYMGDNFCDLFAFLHNEPLLKRGSTLTRKNVLPVEQILSC